MCYYIHMITIKQIIYNKLSDSEKDLLLDMFTKSSLKGDYMALGEVDSISVLNKILENKNLIHFVIYTDGIPTGYCQVIYKADSINFNTGAKINAISIVGEKRGLGLGEKLLEESIKILKENTKIKNIYLDVVKDNVIAVNMYKKFGFKKAGELKNLFTKNGTLMDIEIYSLVF